MALGVSSTDSSSSALLWQMLQRMKSATETTSTQDVEKSSSQESLAKLFESIDSDSDGSISKTEFSSFVTQFSSESASALLDAQESSTQSSTAFESLDSDGDGSISKSELETALSTIPPPPPPSDSDTSTDSSSSSDSTTTASASGSASSEEYDPLDTNEDGIVSMTERMAATGETTVSSLSVLGNKLNNQVMAALLEGESLAA